MVEIITETAKIMGGPLTFAAVVVGFLFNYLRGKKKDKDREAKVANDHKCYLEKELWECSANIKKLLEMHEKYDEDGTPLWYNRKSVSERILKTLEELVTTMNKTNITLNYFINKEK